MEIMQKKTLRTTLLFLLVIIGCGLATYVGFWPWASPTPPVNSLQILSDEIQAHESELITLADGYLADKGRWNLEPFEGTQILHRLENISMDENQNLYFVLKSTFSKNWGVVARSNQGEVLGDGAEPSITVLTHLSGRWWYYEAS